MRPAQILSEIYKDLLSALQYQENELAKLHNSVIEFSAPPHNLLNSINERINRIKVTREKLDELIGLIA